MERIFALLIIVCTSPLFFAISVVLYIFQGLPILYTQKRSGKNKRVFTIYKFRSMKREAETLQEKYRKLNEADGPVFKIYNDPRLTPIGKFLAHTGLDELPQLINIAKGEMSFVGPRPLPIAEANKVPQKYRKRFSVLPGITSPWVIGGSHTLTFRKWMELDIWYVENKSIDTDFYLLTKTVVLVLGSIFRQLYRLLFN